MAGRIRYLTSRRVELAVYLIALLVIGLYVRGAVMGVDSRARTEAGNTKRALCTFRSDLQRRVDDSAVYLSLHPEGIKSLGITAATIRESIRNQRRTLRSLAVLNCPPKEAP